MSSARTVSAFLAAFLVAAPPALAEPPAPPADAAEAGGAPADEPPDVAEDAAADPAEEPGEDPLAGEHPTNEPADPPPAGASEAPAPDDEAPAPDDEAPAPDDEAPAPDDEALAPDDEGPAPAPAPAPAPDDAAQMPAVSRSAPEPTPAASDASEEVHEDLARGEVIVVTGSRTERPLATSIVATELITREDIESSGATSVSELLHQHPGLGLVDTLQGTSISIQGLDPTYVLILVDGRRVIGRVDGAVDLERYSVENIERIEIVKGASSALYGADALAGVVNIITRRPERPVEARVSAQYGGLSTLDTSGLVGVSRGGLSTRLSGGHRRQDAFDLDPDNQHTSGAAVEQWQASSQTAYARGATDLTLSLDYMLRDLRGVNSLVVEGSDATAVLDRINVVELASGSLSGRWRLGQARNLSAAASYSYYRDQFAYDQRGANDLDQYEEAKEKLLELSSQFDGRLSRRHVVTAGVTAMGESLESPRLRTHEIDPMCDRRTGAGCNQQGERYRLAAFVQDEVMLLGQPSVMAVPAMRVDVDSRFGTHVSPKLALRWDPTPRLIVRGSYGRGFRAPDFKQLYLCHENPNAGYFVIGNPDLDPETSHNVNAGVELRAHARVWMSVNLYVNHLDNLIAFDLAGPDSGNAACGVGALSPFTYRNIASAVTHGVETMVRARPHIGPLTGFLVEASYMLNATRDLEEDTPLPGRALHRGTFKLGYEASRVGFDAMLRGNLVGRTYYGPDASLKAHALMDARVAQTLSKQLTLFAGVKNLLSAGDPTYLRIAPRTFYAGISARY